MKFTMSVDMNNAAFDDEPGTELARLLDAVRVGLLAGESDKTLMDVNGNSCGRWAVGEDNAPSASNEDWVLQVYVRAIDCFRTGLAELCGLPMQRGDDVARALLARLAHLDPPLTVEQLR